MTYFALQGYSDGGCCKNERIDFRTNADQKIILERAAELRHASLSSYILTSSLRQARVDLEENEAVILSNRDRNMIMEALEAAPLPIESLGKLSE